MLEGWIHYSYIYMIAKINITKGRSSHLEDQQVQQDVEGARG